MRRKSRDKAEKGIFPTLRRIFFILRLSCLLYVVGLAYQLVRWSHNYDPRFYKFLGTTPGKALSSFMEWPNLYTRVQKEKSFADFSDEEKKGYEQIVNRLQQSWPTHSLSYKNGKHKDVRILRTSPGQIHVREYLGTQGRLESQISTSELSEITPYAKKFPHVSLRDIHFQENFPDFELSYSGHYTILTDAPYYQVSQSVKILEELHTQYLELFSPLIRFPNREQSLQVLFFTNETEYRKHQKNSAPDLANSVGYYSPLEDRMVVFNQQFSNRAKQIREDVGDDITQMLQQARNSSQRQQILRMQQSAEAQIRNLAQQETIATLRHEGAHHLSYAYGIHSWIHTENGWLIEGLAAYFEAPSPGEIDSVYRDSLRYLDRHNRIPALSRLVEIRQPEHFEDELPGLEAHEAYALSWSLFHFCMLPENKEAFFDYIRSLQDPEDLRALMRVPRTQLLAEALGMRPSELELAWRAHLLTLMSGRS
ncbi:DUF1570 domain-containing protein [Kiritimatiellaeota bacterium B1221]|nr:DUF1570 domain-containing protein [Kiritimatiellaeota bacterium B1221]